MVDDGSGGWSRFRLGSRLVVTGLSETANSGGIDHLSNNKFH